MSVTWSQRVRNLTASMGRKPTVDELLLIAPLHDLTPAERVEQSASFVRGMMARCQHGVLDFEQCPKCRRPKP